MSPAQREEIRQAAIKVARESAREQGFPEKITDKAVLAQIAALMRITASPGERRAA